MINYKKTSSSSLSPFGFHPMMSLIIIMMMMMMVTIVSAQLNFLTCDRLLLSGMTDCLKKYAPNTAEKDPCCAYRKFRACNAGLKSGLKVAGQRAGCGTSFLAQANINSLADRLTGAQLSQCKDAKQACRKSSSSSSSNPKSKKPSSSSSSARRTSSSSNNKQGGTLDSLIGGSSPLASIENGISSIMGGSRSRLGGSSSSPLDSVLGGGLSSIGNGFSSIIGSPRSTLSRPSRSESRNSPLSSLLDGSGISSLLAGSPSARNGLPSII